MVDKIWYNMEELIGGSEERGINRNILECKFRGAYTNALTESGINRNILECKSALKRISSRANSGINRNILECKYGESDGYTWYPSNCINRNILECK